MSLLMNVAGCVDQVQLPIRTEEPRLVVEGQITNEAPPYSVRLTYTGNYSGNEQTVASQYVVGAQVSIQDDQGRQVRLVSVGQGMYRTTDTTFRGQVGRTYSLSVVLADGKRYVSMPEQMPAVPVVDSVSSQLKKTANLTKPYVVEYAANTHDPATEKNYYRWTAYGYTNRLSTGVPCCAFCVATKCFDRCWVPISSTDVNIYSDEAVNGNPIRGRAVLQLPIYTIGPQLIEVQQYGMTQTNYQFWKLYQQQNTRTGSIFDPLPAPVVGNVTNASDPTDRARGYFAVTSVTRKRFRQQEYSAPFYGALTTYIAGEILPVGDCRATYGNVPVYEPEGW